MSWNDAEIAGVSISPFNIFSDGRGWLAELFRIDEIQASESPAMGYISVTRPDTTRGPHEHEHQSDRFAFFHGAYRLYLWDSRSDSETLGNRHVIDVGESNKVVVVVPPGVVHAYKNIGSNDAYVLNFPDKLYAGAGKQQPVDEIRHEEIADSPYRMDQEG